MTVQSLLHPEGMSVWLYGTTHCTVDNSKNIILVVEIVCVPQHILHFLPHSVLT